MLEFDVKVDLTELDKLIASLAKGTFINKAGLDTVKELKSLSAVRTGRLKRSIVWEPYKNERAAISTVFYAIPYFGKRRIYIIGIYREQLRAELRRVFK